MRTPITPEPPIVSMSAFMPRPGQPGSLDVFNGENISDYLESFNAECELYGVKADQHAACFPHYCNTEVKDIVTLLGGYESRDWDQLQVEMKKFYWQNDHPKNTFTTLNALIRRSRDLTLSAFVLKFTAITNVLVTNGVMSAADRVIRLLEGLNEGMRIKVIKLCTQKGWRITDQDSGESPNFDEIKKFLDDEAKTNERFAVYARDHTMRANRDVDDVKASPSSASTTAVGSPTPVPMDPAIQALTEQMAALTLLVKSSLSSGNLATSAPTTNLPAPTPIAVTVPARNPHCIWCDSREHSRRSDCTLFIEALTTGNVKINENGRVAFTSTGAEIPPAFGCGGMKSLYDVVYPAAAPVQAAARAITFDDGSDEGVHDLRIVTLGKEKDEWIDMSVDEKRTREDGNRLPRNVCRRMNEPAVRPGTPIESAPTATPAPASGTSPAPSTATMDVDSPDPKPKYRLQSELGKSIGVAEVGEKIMNAPIMLSIKEFLAVSPEILGYIHEQTRCKRIPVEDSSAMASAATSVSKHEADVQVATVDNVSKPYYAIPSGRAVVVLDDMIRVESLLDDGSELNLMAEEVYKELGHPIDRNIHWRINGFDSKLKKNWMNVMVLTEEMSLVFCTMSCWTLVELR